MIRIIAGAFRGKALAVAVPERIRPTSNKVREAVFDILSARVDIAACAMIDYCAGTGAVGFEGLSRGVARVLFIENDRDVMKALSANIVAFGWEGRAAVKSALPPPEPAFEIAFLDPPYADAAITPRDLAPHMRDGGLILHESARREADSVDGCELLRSYRYGKTILHLYEKSA